MREGGFLALFELGGINSAILKWLGLSPVVVAGSITNVPGDCCHWPRFQYPPETLRCGLVRTLVPQIDCQKFRSF